MSRPKFKMHLYRSNRSTWCGRDIYSGSGWTGDKMSWRPVNAEHVTRDHDAATCRTCIKADAAEQRKQGEASRG